MEVVGKRAGRSCDFDLPVPVCPFRPGQTDVGTAAGAECDAGARTGQAGPERREFLAGGEHGHAVGTQCLDHTAVLLRHRLHAGHELLVLALRVVDQRHRRTGNPRQRGDLARMVHAQLDHSQPVRRIQPQQCQRQADLVVQVALGCQRRLRLPGPQDRRDHLRHGSLAVASGDGDQRQLEARAPAGGQLTQRQFGVVHFQPAAAARDAAAVRQRGDRALAFGLGQEIVGVVALAADCDEQVAVLQRPRVAVNAPDLQCAVADQCRAGQPRLGFVQCEHHAATRSSSAACACRMSENGCLAPAIS